MESFKGNAFTSRSTYSIVAKSIFQRFIFKNEKSLLNLFERLIASICHFKTLINFKFELTSVNNRKIVLQATRRPILAYDKITFIFCTRSKTVYFKMFILIWIKEMKPDVRLHLTDSVCYSIER